MSSPVPESGTGVKKHIPFVPEHMQMKEFTLRAVLLGLLMTVVLGAANAYLGLRAGITIAATYPAAVIAMAAMRAWKGSLLEENIARTCPRSCWRRRGRHSVPATLIGNPPR
jgi:hypothetical protein